MATRGITPGGLNVSCLWLNGPSFLLEPKLAPNLKESFSSTNVEERATKHDQLVEVVNVYYNKILTRYSELSVSVKVTAFILRFIENERNKRNWSTLTKAPVPAH